MPSTETTYAQWVKSPVTRNLARLFIAGMLCLHVLVFVGLRRQIWSGYPDFTAFYTAGMIVRQGMGAHLYDPRTQSLIQHEFSQSIDTRHGPLPYIHPPFEAIVFLPLTRFSYRTAFIVWDLLNLGMLFLIALLLREQVESLRFIRPWELAIACLAFFPVYVSLLQGQDAILLMLLCALAYRALRSQSNVIAGCLFALGMFRFQIVIPIVLLLALWKRKGLLAGFLSTGAALLMVSAGIVGWHGLLQYPNYILAIAQSPHLGDVPPELMPNLRGIIGGWGVAGAANGTTLLVLVASLALLFFAVRQGLGVDFDLQFSLAVVVSGLLAWHTNAHDLVLLVFPLLILLNQVIRQHPSARVSLLVPALPLLVSPLWIALWLGLGRLNLMALPLLWWVWEIGREATRSRSAVS